MRNAEDMLQLMFDGTPRFDQALHLLAQLRDVAPDDPRFALFPWVWGLYEQSPEGQARAAAAREAHKSTQPPPKGVVPQGFTREDWERRMARRGK